MAAFPVWTAENHSLVKKHLTPEHWKTLGDLKSKECNYTLLKAVQSTIDNQDSGTGIYAGDEDCYSIFAPVFDPIISEYHGGYTAEKKHVTDMDTEKLVIKDPSVYEDYVISTRIRVGRNIRGYGLSPGITREQRKEVEALVTEGLNSLTGDLSGSYYPLSGMKEEDRQRLVDDHFLFKKGDRFLESCGANRDWPESRGIYHNKEKNFLVWLNEEDQTRIISMEMGADFKAVFSRLSRGISAVEKILTSKGKEFAFNDHHGYIHSCPTNLGTGMRASVHVKIPKVSKLPNFKEICEELRLQPRGTRGEHSEDDSGVYDISNKHRIGYTEVQLVQTVIDGVAALIAKEKELNQK